MFEKDIDPVRTSDISQRPAVSGRSPLLNPESDGTFLYHLARNLFAVTVFQNEMFY